MSLLPRQIACLVAAVSLIFADLTLSIDTNVLFINNKGVVCEGVLYKPQIALTIRQVVFFHAPLFDESAPISLVLNYVPELKTIFGDELWPKLWQI